LSLLQDVKHTRCSLLQRVQASLTIDAFNEAIEEKAKAAKEAEQRTKEFEEMKTRLDSFEQAEQSRKEHEAELEGRIEKMISRMDSMIVKIHEVNPKMPSLPTKELQDTFASIVGKDEGEKKRTKNARTQTQRKQ
jgi:predicted nuclease with TOPRIM domain